MKYMRTNGTDLQLDKFSGILDGGLRESLPEVRGLGEEAYKQYIQFRGICREEGWSPSEAVSYEAHGSESE